MTTRITENAPLAPLTWFRVGGPAELLVSPTDEESLAAFLRGYDGAVLPIGVGSNLLVRDGGIEGAVIRLGRGFNAIEVEGARIRAGSAALDAKVAMAAAQAGLAGLEFFRGIPVRGGAVQTLKNAELGFAYRHSALPTDAIILDAVFEGTPDEPEAVKARMDALMKGREDSQPIREKTGGSTFRNPEGESAWKLIDGAGCRGLVVGDAQMSEKHCNFMINRGAATASDLETLGETVREGVLAASGHDLHWEIKRIGKRAL